MKNLLKNNNLKFGCILVSVMIIMVLIFMYVASIKNVFYTSGEEQDSTGNLICNTENTEYTQWFTAVADNLEKINIEFNTLDEESGGTVLIGIKDENGVTINEKEITRNYLRGKSNFEFEFDKQKKSKGKRYQLYFRFYDLGEYSKFISLKYTDKNEYTDNSLYVNQELKENEAIIFKDMYKSSIRQKLFWTVMIVMITCIMVVSFIIYLKPNMKIENMFLLISIVTYLFFFIAMPTFKNHDEYYHWLRAYEVSQGDLVTPLNGKVQGSNMPGGVSEIATENWINIKYSTMKDTSKISLNYDKKGILNSETAAVYSFVQYIPQSFGIFIGRLFTDKALILTYFGRFFNMIMTIGIIYLSIKIIPFGKKILLVSAMLPIAIEGFTSLSPDALTISISYLYIAYIMHISFSENIKTINVKQKSILLVMSVIIALCKIVYIPLVGLLLVIPKEKFKNKRKMLNICIIAAISVTANLCWLYFSSRYLGNFREGDSKIQVLLALQNPIQYIQNMLYTINLNANSYVMSLYGNELGWCELIKINSIVPYILILLHIISVVTDDTIKNKLKKNQIIWMSMVFLSIVGLILTSLYVQWTMIGKESIVGVQGRYFLPILPIALIVIASKIKIKSLYNEKNIDKVVAITAMCVQVFVVSQIMIANL